MSVREAPGSPGSPPRWTSSAKSGVGTALATSSNVWFTLSHGILNEVYFPRLDLACIRDLGLVVTDGGSFFSEEKRDATSHVEQAEDGVPIYCLANTCKFGHYRIEKEILTDPQRDVVLQRIRFVPLTGKMADYRLFVLLAPHLRNRGSDNTATVSDYKGLPMLFAHRPGVALALASSAPWVHRSAGFVGTSDGWQDLKRHGRMTWEYEQAANGNVCLAGEIDIAACGGEFVLALGFGRGRAEAGLDARQSLLAGFAAARDDYLAGWQAWQGRLRPDRIAANLYRASAAVLRIHQAKTVCAGTIASLSIPWGATKGDDDLGGYHLVWPRDLVETAGGLMAVGALTDARDVLFYLATTQEADGHWPQNMWLDGTPYWTGQQMDETAFPILLLDMLLRGDALQANDFERLWPMARAAAGFVVRNGPVTQEDRWEEDAGYSPFTLAVEIAALAVAADLAERAGEGALGRLLGEVADAWNADIERWTYVTDTDLSRQVGIDGYYVRISSADVADAASPTHGYVPIKNRPPGACVDAAHFVSPDALALVRFGLRAPDDPRIVSTVRAIDALLRVELPGGPCWHRYNGDGYGEHADGAPFDGIGIGRAWPLLTGERAHFELAAGRSDEARRLLQTMEALAGAGGMISEQVWDDADVPERELFLGRPSGAARPLVWAHAEYVKLCRSMEEGAVFDTPPSALRRFVQQPATPTHSLWCFHHKARVLATGRTLRVLTATPAVVRWSSDGWTSFQDTPTHDSGIQLHFADLGTTDLTAGTHVSFTFRWLAGDRWEGENFDVLVADDVPTRTELERTVRSSCGHVP